MKRYLAFIIIGMLLLTILPLTITVCATDPWYSSNFTYRKALNITGNILGCQMRIVIGNTTGGNVTCSSHVKNDFRDLVFTDISKNTLPYWIENYTTGGQATVWINNTQNVSKIYMYYGYSLATSLSNGNTTFYFFDHFNGTSYNTQKWNALNGTSPVLWVNQSIICLEASINSGYIRTTKLYGLNYGIVARVKAIGTIRPMNIGFKVQPLGYITPPFVCMGQASSTKTYTMWSDGVTNQYGTGFTNRLTYYKMKLIRTSTKVIGYYNDTLDSSSSSNIPTGNLFLAMGKAHSTDLMKICCDWLFIKKFWNIEPRWLSFGAEEIKSNYYPVNSNNSPSMYYVALSYPILSISISDPNGDYMNHTFRSNFSGTWNVLKYTNHTLNATITYTANYTTNKTIYWSSNTTDNKSAWDNDTYLFFSVKVPSHNISFINNHINTTWTHQYKYDVNSGYIIYDNDTGNTSATLKLYLFENIFNATGFHNYTLNSTGYTVYANYTGNCSNVSFDPNSTGLWLYLGAMLTLDNGQFFLLILIGLWSYFIYLYYKEKEVIFSFCIICCGLPLGIILSGVAYYNSYPFGYLISFILILISFLIPTYGMYQKNKKKK